MSSCAVRSCSSRQNVDKKKSRGITFYRFEEEDNDSFSESSDEEKLKKYRKNQDQNESDSEVEVFGVGSEQSDISLSDIEGQGEDDNLPDVRAWGKEKKKYYGADYVDPDYGGFQGKDAQAAEIEEEEAKNLQNQLIQQLDDDDFGLDIVLKKVDKENREKSEEHIKKDLSKLTTSEKLAILVKESPEFQSLIQDFKAKIEVAKTLLEPIINKVKTGEIEHCKAVECVQTYYELILNYCTNIYMYLLLRGTNKLKNHPIIKRLYQYRQLIIQIESVFQEVLKPQIDILLSEELEAKEDAGKKRKTLKLLTQLQEVAKPKKSKAKSDSDRSSKKPRLGDSTKETSKKVTFKSDSSEEEHLEEGDAEKVEENTEEPEEPGKRAITYQIAKNKGLTPYRKKELRNPRVKHKLKFRKALIRRKGAVREPRKELTRYGGEISGINASVSKSIKIKS